MAVKVEVTEKDIRCGVRNDPTECPVALAVARSLGVADGLVEVDPDSAIGVNPWNLLKYEATYKMLVKVREFVRRFDEGKPVKTFSFYLRETKGGR